MLKAVKEILVPFSEIWNHKLITIAGIKLGLGNVLVALTLLLFATRLSRLVSRTINQRLITPFVHDNAARNTYQTFAFYLSLALVVTLSMTVAGIPLTIFTVLGGALAIGVGFGSQNIVNNFISGIILLVERPVKVGDVITIDGMIGTIFSIGTRSTKIRNPDNKVLIIPNSFLLEKAVINNNYESTIIRSSINFGVAYGTDVKKLELVCLDILLNHEDILQDPLPLVIFQEFADSTLNFQLIFYADTEKTSILVLPSEIRFKIDEKFKEHGIEMAFPQRDMNLKINQALEVKLLS